MNENDIKLNLGIRIKHFRTKKGMTQDKFAEKINRTQRQVSLIEVGKSFPSPETLASIISVLDCSIQDLFDFEPITNLITLKIELFKIIENLPDDKLKILYHIGRNL